MRITFVLPTPGMNGGTRVLAIYAKALVDMGHKVVLVSVPIAQTRFLHRLQDIAGLRDLPRSHLDGLGLDHRVLKTWRPVVDADVPDADIIVATWWETAEWVASMSPRKGGKVYFVQGHEVFHDSIAARCQATYRLPMRKIVVARWLKDVMAASYGDHDAVIVPNSVDQKQFHAPPRGKQDRPTLGFLYSHSSVKGTDLALRVVDELRRRIPDLRVISFGSDQPSEMPMPGIEFSHSPAQYRLRDLYASCDLWLTASRSEGFNLTAMEAMACRTPVVATRTGWPEDAIVNKSNGICVNIDDLQALIEATHWVLGLDDPRWRDLSRAAFETVKDASWERSAKEFEQALIGFAQ